MKYEELGKSEIQREQVEKALREAESKYRSIFENAVEGIFQTTLDGNFLAANPALARMLGYGSPEELMTEVTNVRQLYVHPERRDEVICLMQEQGIVTGFDIQLRRRDGGEIWVSENSRALRDSGGKIAGFEGMLVDITERKRSEEELKNYAVKLERANRLKDLFIDIMRHDLLNPLSVIKTMSEVKLDETKDEGTRKMLLTIKRNADKIIDMIKNASTYANLENAEELERVRLDLNEVFRTVIENFRSQLEEKNMKLEYLVSGECFAMVNPMIEDVFTNLLSNSIKYSPPGGEIEINIIDKNDNYRIYVKDWGFGIKDEDKAKLFTRFKRVDKKGVKGTGLGLAIVKRIVDLHGGRVWIEDNPEGGCIFYVEIPKDQ